MHTHTTLATTAPANTNGSTGSIITKLPHPEKHPVSSCRGGSRKAGSKHTHATDEATVSSSAGGPTKTICTERLRVVVPVMIVLVMMMMAMMMTVMMVTMMMMAMMMMVMMVTMMMIMMTMMTMMMITFFV